MGEAKELLRLSNAIVTTQHVSGGGAQIPIEHVLSVHTSRKSFSKAVVVKVFDLTRRAHPFTFTSRDDAVAFISALRKANGSIQVEGDGLEGFIAW